MDADWEPKIRGQSLGDGAPRVTMVVTAQNPDIWSPPARSIPFGPAAMVLHVEPSRSVLVTGDLVDALAELRVGIGSETCSYTFVGCGESRATIFAHIMSA